MLSTQLEFADTQTRGSFYVLKRSVDLSIAPKAEDAHEPTLLPQARSKRRLSCSSKDASERGGFWEYPLDALDDPEDPVEEVLASSASWQVPTNPGVERCTSAWTCFPEEPSRPQRHPTTTSMGWDTAVAQHSVGSLPLPSRVGDRIMPRDRSTEAENTQDEDTHKHISNEQVDAPSSGHIMMNAQDGQGANTKTRHKHLHKSRKSGSKSRRRSDTQFRASTPLLAPVEEMSLEDEGLVQCHADSRNHPAGNDHRVEVASGQDHGACRDVSTSKYLLKSEEKSLSAAEEDRARYDEHVELCDEQEKAALQANVSRLKSTENNGAFFFADETLGWYGVGYGSYVHGRPDMRKRVEFYHILFHRGVIEALPQVSSA